MASSTGPARSSYASSAPTMMARSPVFARVTSPETGASIMVAPHLASLAAILRVLAGWPLVMLAAGHVDDQGAGGKHRRDLRGDRRHLLAGGQDGDDSIGALRGRRRIGRGLAAHLGHQSPAAAGHGVADRDVEAGLQQVRR